MRKALIIVVCLIGLSASFSYAGNLDDADLAYDKGDFKTAFNLYLIEAKKGNAEAQFDLGLMYDLGKGVLQDYKEAALWYRLSADQGAAAAQYNLGVLYDKGRGVLQDYKEAVKWYTLAADQGHMLAKCNLSIMYAEGSGIKKDLAIAKKLAKEGIDTGEESCQEVWNKYNLAKY